MEEPKPSNFFTANKESSSIENPICCASLPSPSPSESFSTRIQLIIESRREFGFNMETKIEESKAHWSELEEWSDEEGSA